MKELIENNKKIIFAVNIILAFLVYNKLDPIGYTIVDRIASFMGTNILLLIYVIYKQIKKRPIDVLWFTILTWIPILLHLFSEWNKGLWAI